MLPFLLGVVLFRWSYSIQYRYMFLLCVVISAASLASSKSDNERKVIAVSASTHEPYVLQEGQFGLTTELIAAMNSVQNKYQFVFKRIPVKRVFQSVEERWVDIVAWDNPMWGWRDKYDVQVSLPLSSEKDRFITLKINNRTQAYFDSFTGKTLTLVNGYHYQFRKQDSASPLIDYLTIFVKAEQSAIKMVTGGRADIAVVSESALDWHYHLNPESKGELLVSERYDSDYERYFVIPAKADISKADLNAILRQLSKSNHLKTLYAKYGLVPPLYE